MTLDPIYIITRPTNVITNVSNFVEKEICNFICQTDTISTREPGGMT